MKSFYKIYTLLAFMILSIAAVFSQTTVSSIISSNQTWTASGSPYVITGNTLIESGVTVTVDPDVVIETTADRLKLIVDGTFKAIGKKDSAIFVDNLTIEFTAKSVGYDVKTGTGSQFHYVMFDGNEISGGKTIDIKAHSMLVKNCKFIDGYYYIYAYGANGSGDTTDLIIENSVFKGKTSYPSGYMVYTSGNIRLNITDCYAENIGGITISKWTTIKKSTFKNFGYSSGLRQTQGQELILECNLFQNFRYTLVDLTYPGTDAIIEIRENTFDSSEVLLKLRGGLSYKPKSLVIENNNFLRFKTNSVQVSVGSNPGKADTLNLTKNYWGTSTKADIELGIKDFTDDITIEGYIDFSGYLTSPVKTCTGGGTIGGADTTGINSGITKIVDNALTLYPNPADGQVQVLADGRLISHIKVLDLQGKTHIENVVTTTQSTVDLSLLVEGIYVIEVSGDGFISRNKLIVKH